MLRKSKVKGVFLRALLVTMVLITLWILPQKMMFSSASPASGTYSLSVSPTRIQEGLNTTITLNLNEATANASFAFKINVTSPANFSSFFNLVVSTNETGSGSNETKFWGDFGTSANTSYVGVYKVAVNETLATANFTVGLTDKLKYLRSENVSIRGSGYNASETVGIDIKFGGLSVTGFPKNVTARPNGTVIDSWVIPTYAPLGVYTLTLANATTGGTVKKPVDTQTFTVEAICEIQTRTPAPANETVTGVTVEVYNATTGEALNIPSQDTNETGWIRFILAGGNYTFKAFWKNVEVGAVNKTVNGNVVLYLTVWLSNIKLTVTDKDAIPLPWIDLNLKYNVTLKGQILPVPETDSFTTNVTGSIQIMNMFTNISYLIEASRYGFLFNTTHVKNLTTGWNNITIIAPKYTMSVHLEDSKSASAVDLKVEAYEWSSGIGEPLQSRLTDSNGNVTFSLTFGRYRLRVYKNTTFVNEATVDWVQNQSFYPPIRIDVYNVDLSVLVVDYFGQPIPNVSVEFQRKSNSNYETTQTKTTSSNGVALFTDIIGGDSRVYASVAGRPGETQYLYLVGPRRDVVFKMDGYVTVAGYALETSQFVTIVTVLILIVAFFIASNYKRLPRLLQRRRK